MKAEWITMLDFFEALIRAGAGEKYFENPATLSFVIAPLLRTVKRITEVTYNKDIIIDNANVNIFISIAIYLPSSLSLPLTMLLTLLILKIFCKGEYFQLLILF